MKNSSIYAFVAVFISALVSSLIAESGLSEKSYDVVIYGGTSAGVAAAVQTARLGKSVILIEPGNHLGGLSSGGLGMTDIGNKHVIGGLAREFYHRVYKHYSIPAAWNYQIYEDFAERQTDWDDDKIWWRFEPSVAENIFKSMIEEAGVCVVFNERLDLESAVDKKQTILKSIRMESGKTFPGKIFMDATYEGDLMARAGVTYTVGRESNQLYGENLNGVQTQNAIYHQFVEGIDPYIEKGNPQSGLLPGIDPDGPGDEGGGDSKVQAYCFRMCLTDVPENRIGFEKPAGYDPLQYELLLRNFEAGARVVPWHNSAMPNRKTDTNNNRGVSTDYIGQNYDWPESNYAVRDSIFKAHLLYQKGLMWTLANHPRVPDSIRTIVSRWGLAADEFTETGNWSHQIYVREARRMISDYVMTEKNCTGEALVTNSVGMAAYTMDSHNTQRYIDKKGYVKNEGDVEVGGFPPYPVSYQSIIPPKGECGNLFVPVCLSASHIAFGSIRMEPVFMVLGQSAAIAACLAIDHNKAVQYLNYDLLRPALLNAGQILEVKNRLPESQFILNWWLLGPFERKGPEGLLTVYPPESELDTTKTYPGRNNQQIQWQKYDHQDSQYVNLVEVLSPSDKGVAYALKFIEVETDTLMDVGIGSNDGVRLWINGVLHLDRQKERRAVPNEDILQIPFKKGRNTILLKIDQAGGGWGFFFSIIEGKNNTN